MLREPILINKIRITVNTSYEFIDYAYIISFINLIQKDVLYRQFLIAIQILFTVILLMPVILTVLNFNYRRNKSIYTIVQLLNTPSIE